MNDDIKLNLDTINESDFIKNIISTKDRTEALTDLSKHLWEKSNHLNNISDVNWAHSEWIYDNLIKYKINHWIKDSTPTSNYFTGDSTKSTSTIGGYILTTNVFWENIVRNTADNNFNTMIQLKDLNSKMIYILDSINKSIILRTVLKLFFPELNKKYDEYIKIMKNFN